MRLNDEQQEFINSKESTVLVACPGGGKTTAIAYKYCKLVKEINTRTTGIALLSFTNVASDELEKKIYECSNYKINTNYPNFVGTIDSFFNLILKRFGYLILNKTPSMILDFTKKYPRANCHHCSNHNWDAYLNLEGKYVIKNKEFSCSLDNNYYCLKYLKDMLKKGIILQSCVPFFLNYLLKKYKNVGEIISKRFPIIIIDEAQDTSLEQSGIFDLLENFGIRINYVGDPDQSIYEWRNAYPEFFYKKMNESSYKQIRLIRNNRSSQLICDATKRFVQSLSTMDDYISDAQSKDCKIKPILLIYNSTISYEKIKEFFMNKLKEFNLSSEEGKFIILQNFNDNKNLTFDDIYKSDNKFMYYYMNGIKNFFYGNRRVSDEHFLNCLRILKNGDVVSDDDDTLIKYLYEFRNGIVLLNGEIGEWEEKTSKKINEFVNKYNDVFHSSNLFELKSRIQGYSRYKTNLIKPLFMDVNVKKPTIHSVKGKTYESVLLYTEGNRRVNGSLLVSNNYNEHFRTAFVGMTRAQKFLCVAVDMKLDYSTAFPPAIWNYIELNE